MKNIRFFDFEIYLLQESLKKNKSLIAKEDFPSNSFVTKEYFEMMISQLEEKLNQPTTKEKVRRLNATA